jgi:predicted nucleotidyltransferase
MQDLIEKNREKIAELCRQHHVRSLSVFGSAARDDFDPTRSDIDLLVDFNSLSEMDYAPNYFAFMEHLDHLFGRKVDIITSRFIRNPYLRQEVERDRVLLYAA